MLASKGLFVYRERTVKGESFLDALTALVDSLEHQPVKSKIAKNAGAKKPCGTY